MKTVKAWSLFALILTVCLAVGVSVVKKRREEISKIPTPQVRPIPVNCSELKEGSLRERFRYVGTVFPYRYATLSTRVSGEVLKVFKEEGDTFKRGELLLTIDSSKIEKEISALKRKLSEVGKEREILEKELSSARVILKNALEEFKREKFLYENGAVPKSLLEKAENNKALAESKVEVLKLKVEKLRDEEKYLREKIGSLLSDLRYARVVAPEDGVVSKLFVHEGDFALPGKPLLEVIYPKFGMKLLLKVPPDEAEEIPLGSPVYLNGSLIGKVEKVYPSAESSLYVLEVKLKGGKFKWKEKLTVEVLGKEYRGKLVPLNSILHAKDGDYVLAVLKDGHVKPVKVRIVKVFNGKAIVDTSLPVGTPLVTGRESKLLEVYRLGRVLPVGGNGE